MSFTGIESIEGEESGGVARVVNKTFNSLRTSNIRPASAEELKVYLKSKKKLIFAIVYYIREGTPEFISQLLRTELLIIPETKRLLSKSKQSDPEQLKEYLKLHRVQNWS